MESLYSKLKKQVSTKISDGLQLIKRSSSATSAQFNDMSFEMGPQAQSPFNKTGELNQSQTSLKSHSNSMAQSSDRTLDFGNGPPAIHDGPQFGGQPY